METVGQIRYDGDWPANERTIVESAVKTVNAGIPSRTLGPAAPWILIRRKTGAEQVYLASYIQVENIATGRTAEALARGIRRLF